MKEQITCPYCAGRIELEISNHIEILTRDYVTAKAIMASYGINDLYIKQIIEKTRLIPNANVDKIAAIKEVRNKYNIGLKEAKLIVEAMMEK